MAKVGSVPLATPDPLDDDVTSVLSSPKRAVPGAVHGTGPWGVSNAPAGQVVLNDEGGGSFTAPMGGTPEDEAARFRQYANLQLRQQNAKAVADYFEYCKVESVEADIAEAVFMGAVNGFAVQRGIDLKALKVDAEAKHGAEYLAKSYVAHIGSNVNANTSTWLAKTAAQVWNVTSGVSNWAFQCGRDTAATNALNAAKLAAEAKKLQAAFDRKRLSEAAAAMPREGAAADLSPAELDKLHKRIGSYMSKMKMSSAAKAAFMRAMWSPDATKLGEQLERLREEAAASSYDGQRWGQMVKRTLSMTRRAVRHSFRHRPTFIGAFRYPHRALIPAMDGRAWHAKLPGLGGTVLLDLSGSMNINEQQLQDMLHRSPLATIAGYFGCGWVARDGWTGGDLVIFAKEGRYAAQKVWPRSGGGNVVDGPALRWLAKQPRPRAWISDGGVTGAQPGGGEQSGGPRLKLECSLICRVAGVTQYANIDDYLKSHHFMSQWR